MMDLNKIEFFDLEKKRAYLFQAEEAYKILPQLKTQRDEIERKILDAQKQIEKEFYQTSKKASFSFLEELKGRLSHLNQEMKILDFTLDKWDDLNEYQLHILREELFLGIWKNFPNQYEENKLQWYALKTDLILNAEIKKVRKIVDQLSEVLQIIMEARASIKGRGIFSYIFGISPNTVIERHLLLAHEIITKAEPELKHAMHQSRNTDLYVTFQTISEVTDQLKDQCKTVWGFRHIDTTIAKAEKDITQLAIKLKNKQKAILNRADELKNQLDEWLKSIPPV